MRLPNSSAGNDRAVARRDGYATPKRLDDTRRRFGNVVAHVRAASCCSREIRTSAGG